MSEKKSKVYAVEGVTFDKVSFSFVNDKLIGVSEMTSRNTNFKPISPSDPSYNTLINSDQAKRAFNIATEGSNQNAYRCLLYTSPSPRDLDLSRMPSSA